MTSFRRRARTLPGIAIFGSLLLTNYHHDFSGAIPDGMPQEVTLAFSNPLLLPQMQPQLASIFNRCPGGADTA